jgi:hypothetical protein
MPRRREGMSDWEYSLRKTKWHVQQEALRKAVQGERIVENEWKVMGTRSYWVPVGQPCTVAIGVELTRCETCVITCMSMFRI